jgi:hypothetical protein
MKELQRIHRCAELPQTGSFAHVGTKEELLAALGFCSLEDIHIEPDDRVVDSLCIHRADRADTRSEEDDYPQQPSIVLMGGAR